MLILINLTQTEYDAMKLVSIDCGLDPRSIDESDVADVLNYLMHHNLMFQDKYRKVLGMER